MTDEHDEIDLWAFAGEQLGLTMDADGRLAGHDPYGVPLTAERLEGRTRVRAALDFPLRMGLHLRVRGAEEVAAPGPLGFSTLEAVYEIEVVDVEHAKRVLGPCVPALLEAALRAKRFDLALGLANERAALKPTSAQNWRAVARAFRGRGDKGKADRASAQAEMLVAA